MRARRKERKKEGEKNDRSSRNKVLNVKNSNCPLLFSLSFRQTCAPVPTFVVSVCVCVRVRVGTG